MNPFCFRKLKTELRMQEVKIFKGTDSKVIGLKLEGSSVVSIMETFHFEFQLKLQLQISLLQGNL